MTLRVFMQHLTRALTTKTGRSKSEIVRAARKAYGAVVGYAEDHPDSLERLSRQIDFLPGGRDPIWYAIYLKELIADEQCAEKERAIRGRPWNSDQKHQPIDSLVDSILASMTSRHR